MSINIMDSGMIRGNGFDTRAADMRDSRIQQMIQGVTPDKRERRKLWRLPQRNRKMIIESILRHQNI